MRKKKLHGSKKIKSSKRISFPKRLFILPILLIIIIMTVFQVQQRQTFIEHAQILGCGDPGDPGNADGVGKYCTKGGGQCIGTGSPICSADIESGSPGLCSKPCLSDSDCGAGAVCYGSSLGKGCEPIACEAALTPTRSPTPTNVPIPTSLPTKATQPIAAPTNVVPTAAATKEPTQSPGNTTLQFTVDLDDIGNTGDSINPNANSLSNKNPIHTQRQFIINVKNSQGQSLGTYNGNFIYSSSTDNFTGIINIGNTVSTGSYSITVATLSYLGKTVSNIQLTAGMQVTIPSLTLTAGDVNGDGAINMLDYNILISCYGDSSNTANCPNYQAADINDDGIVDGTDYNIFLRELSSSNAGK